MFSCHPVETSAALSLAAPRLSRTPVMWTTANTKHLIYVCFAASSNGDKPFTDLLTHVLHLPSECRGHFLNRSCHIDPLYSCAHLLYTCQVFGLSSAGTVQIRGNFALETEHTGSPFDSTILVFHSSPCRCTHSPAPPSHQVSA